MAATQSVTLEADIGLVKLGDTVLPGEYQKMNVHRALRMPEASSSGRSGSTKVPQGWEDAEISLELVLCETDERTVRDQVQEIAGLFMWQDEKARPQLYRITHWLTAAWGVHQVVFVDVDGGDDNQSDTVSLTLRFKEFKPPPRKVEARRKRPESTTAGTTVDGLPAAATGNGQVTTDWLGHGVTVAGETEPEQSFFYDAAFSGDMTLNNPNSQLRPSADEDLP